MNEITLLEKLVDAKLDTWTACFSDSPYAQKLDDERWASLFASQSEYTENEIVLICQKLWNSEVTRKELFG